MHVVMDYLIAHQALQMDLMWRRMRAHQEPSRERWPRWREGSTFARHKTLAHTPFIVIGETEREVWSNLSNYPHISERCLSALRWYGDATDRGAQAAVGYHSRSCSGITARDQACGGVHNSLRESKKMADFQRPSSFKFTRMITASSLSWVYTHCACWLEGSRRWSGRKHRSPYHAENRVKVLARWN